MQRKTLVMGLLLFVSIFMAGVTDLIGANNLLAPYETDERAFRRVEISDKIVFFHQRMVGEAIVEKDFIVYQFDRDTETLIDKKVHWRDETPEHPTYEPSVIPKEEEEVMVDGEVVSRQLYIISPESDIFPIEPTPTNPCWVVTSVQEGNTIITIIDAVTGKRLGYGIPPPQVKGFTFTGPYSNNPCTGGWTTWYNNARDWFETMGYPTESVFWPTEETIKSHIQSAETVMFYEIAHGGSNRFASGCIGDTTYEYTTATEVENWIADYKKMPFTFIASCDGMCSTGPGTFSYEFKKGSNDDTATIGYCGMSYSQCWNPGTCWSVSVDWQTALFKYMSYGWPIEAAYNQAMADYPQCWPGEGACMRFAGDPNLVLASIGTNINLISPNGGEELFVGYNFEITWTSEENIENIKIEYLNNNGNDWIEIVANTENDGFHNWEVPCDISAECLIRISDLDSTESDISDHFFSIIDINDTDSDGTPDCMDNCPYDPNKVEPGICGCGIADTDTDSDGTSDCNDNCPNDPEKIEPGICGCGISDIDSDEDGTPNCNDNCDNDPNKTELGICGCGIADTDTDLDGIPDCNDNCPNDPGKTEPGTCGCGVSDTDTDSDGTLDCNDNCPNDPQKIQPGICGCGVADIDTDSDGTLDCNDNCPYDPNKTGPGICGCGIADTDSDGDGIPDCNDDCNNLIDSDGDGTSDCDDLCPNDPNKTQPGTCGCSIPDTDSDGDETPDCLDTNDDNDGLPDGEEQGPDGNDQNYDGNNDGTADCLQDNVASFHTYDDLNYVTMESPAGTSIIKCTAEDNPSKTNAPSDVEFFYGFFGFKIDGVGIGGSTTVTLYLPAGETIDTYYKYGPTPNNTTNHWYEFLYDGETGAEINGNVITLHFVDGERGDDDLTANGIVIDVGAPAVDVKSSSGETIVTSDSGSGGGCFIATAAYGSLMEPHVKILRDFRDRFLLGNIVGDNFVRLYYTYSPSIADFIAEHDSLRAIVRISLLPVVGVCWVTLKLDPPTTITLLLFLGISLIGIAGIMRKLKK